MTGLVILAGAGYLFIKSATIDIYRAENNLAISDLNQKYDENLKNERKRYEWQRFHNYGKNYVYLAELYAATDMDKNLKTQQLAKLLSRGETYFSYALDHDPQQASTYWELGEINFTHAKTYGLNDRINLMKALDYYKRATEYYSESEIAKGWRADAYRMIGVILLAQLDAKESSNRQQIIKDAKKYLEKSRKEYENSVPNSREYNKESLEKVTELLLRIADHTIDEVSP